MNKRTVINHLDPRTGLWILLIDYGNSRLLFRLWIYRYDKDNGGDGYGNKKDNS